jgi:hypothetical protein
MTEVINKESNNLDFNRLNQLRETIENMSKFNQIEILRLLTNHTDVIINENKYGIHINLTELNQHIIDELEVYIKYVKAQEIELYNVEKQKEDYKNTFFHKT